MFMGWKSALAQEILYLLNLKYNPNKSYKGDGFFYIVLYPHEMKVFEDVLNKVPSYKNYFFGTDGVSQAIYASFQRVRKYPIPSSLIHEF